MVGRKLVWAAARTLRAAVYSIVFLTIATTVHSAGTSSNGSAANTQKAPSKQAIKPTWIELTPAQQQALAPLSSEWDKLDGFRKKKWLEIGDKFAAMKPDEQARVQQRMREWAKLTPEQRRVARESYARAKKLNPDQKSAQWQQYQQLSEDQKKKLAADASRKPHIANLPSAQSKTKIVPPIRSTVKRASTPPSVTADGIENQSVQPAPQPTPVTPLTPLPVPPGTTPAAPSASITATVPPPTPQPTPPPAAITK